jgi:GT2 family glycosyltransferase
VSDHGGLAEQVQDGVDGLRFRPGDASELARALKRLLDEPALLARLAAAPVASVTMDEHAAALDGVYQRARARVGARAARVGVVVLDRGEPAKSRRALRSAAAAGLATQCLIVENGPGPDVPAEPGLEVLRLPRNLGFAAGMNAGLRRLRERGCDRLLLLNNDAVLEPGCVRGLAEALEDPSLAAVGPVVLRSRDGRVESRGLAFDPAAARARLLGSGEVFVPREGRLEVEALSGAVMMLSAAALERVGPLDEGYFHSFEDADWCVRARRAGFRLEVVLGARARHEGAATLGRASSDRFYYAARGQLRAAGRLAPRSGSAGLLRTARIVARHLGHALLQRDARPPAALRAVLEGARDFRRGRTGPRGGAE